MYDLRKAKFISLLNSLICIFMCKSGTLSVKHWEALTTCGVPTWSSSLSHSCLSFRPGLTPVLFAAPAVTDMINFTPQCSFPQVIMFYGLNLFSFV